MPIHAGSALAGDEMTARTAGATTAASKLLFANVRGELGLIAAGPSNAIIELLPVK
jgi:hypothetical protein